MRVLITGGTGFLGRNLYEYIRRVAPDVEVEIFSRRTGSDVRNYEQVSKAVYGKNVVFHLAAQTHVDFSLHNDREDQKNFIDTNLTGTLNVLHACREHGVKMIHCSTSEVYGSNVHPGKPMDENHPLLAQAGIYATSKAGADLTVRMAYLTEGQDIVIIRPFNMWGPGQSVEKFIPRIIDQVQRGIPITINGDGEQKRDYVHVRDVAKAFWLAKDLPAGTIANIASGETLTVKSIVGMVQHAFHNRVPKINFVDARPAEVRELLGDATRFKNLTGWEPETFVDQDSINSLVGWYEENGFIRQPKL